MGLRYLYRSLPASSLTYFSTSSLGTPNQSHFLFFEDVLLPSDVPSSFRVFIKDLMPPAWSTHLIRPGFYTVITFCERAYNGPCGYRSEIFCVLFLPPS